jgi:carboxylesterase type B
MTGPGTYGTSEDCLTLNVFRPFEIEDPLPVMIWIHGGSFVAGTAGDPLFDGSKLAQTGVIVITLNYRLAAFSRGDNRLPEAVEYVRQTSYLRAILQILKESLKPKADKSGEEK